MRRTVPPAHFAPHPIRACAVVMVLALAAGGPAAGTAPAARENQSIEIQAIELSAAELAPTRDFYSGVFDFEVEETDPDGWWTLLHRDEARILLRRSDLPPPSLDGPSIYLNFSVADLDATERQVLAHGGSIAAARLDSAVGPYSKVLDPAGNPLDIIDHPWDDLEVGDPPVLFNIGIHVLDIAAAEPFYRELGLEVATRDYLPDTLVFGRHGMASVVLHPLARETGTGTTRTGALLLSRRSSAVGSASASLPFSPRWLEGGSSAGLRTLRDPTGNGVRVLEESPAIHDAQAEFDRIRGLAGRWQASSSKGWSEEITFEVIARRSAVVQRTAFADHPDDTMITVFHLDGDRLLLTHYCEARNQPRLVATEADGETLRFEFLDGTSLTSREEGHMDQAVFTFHPDGSFSSRWTWYQDGEEGWLEEIDYRRGSEKG